MAAIKAYNFQEGRYFSEALYFSRFIPKFFGALK